MFIQKDCEAQAVERLDAAARSYGIEPLAITEALSMNREELRQLSSHPLAALGAHTVSHRALMRLSPEMAGHEMQRSAEWLQDVTGNRPTSFAYPYGNRAAVSIREQVMARELGFSVAVTTQPGTLGHDCLGRLTGLPRISLNGFYQEPRYVAALASGISVCLVASGLKPNERSRIHPHLFPAFTGATEFHPIMKPELTIVPELDR